MQRSPQASWRGDPLFNPVFIIDQDAQGRTVKIIELAVFERPEKGRKAKQAKPKRYGDQKGDPGHRATPFSRKAFPTTIIDDPDMASAAINGVTKPIIASGTATIL